MNDPVSLSLQTGLIAGLVCPPVVSFLKQARWSTQANHAVAFLISGAAASIGLFIDHQINAPSVFTLQWLLTSVVTVHAVSQLVYAMYFGGSSLDTKLTAIGSGPSTTVAPWQPPPTPIPQMIDVTFGPPLDEHPSLK